MIFLSLYYNFFKIGLFALGGGLATIPFLQELGKRTGWITDQQLLDAIAIAESTPGPVGINIATFIGFNIEGIPGSLVAVGGLITPSVVLIIIIAHFFTKFSDNQYVKNAFYGIRPVVAGIICAAGLELGYKIFFIQPTFLYVISRMALCLVAYILIIKYKKHPVVYILGGAILGVLLKL
ncbi:chromate transporter [Candidatus Epulonipiscium fishelsonii]|uniref:Chromate transporter n=1 Tax=Candidatus Epulonipiscium fishelsonii TaxID=77094 RepID=A0ACC8XF60_9FIRM|nr:chromate transporter [Epulopiscium sp. SCG-D08WGA-EpuloA1]